MECCYGAELYDWIGLGLSTPICQTYMAQKAYGYFGSTTIAYGPAEGNGAADLITQYFLLEVQAGHSIGLAALKAQQRYVEQADELDPIDLKTLAQFYLLGDPSVQPVKIASVTRTPTGIAAVAKRSVRAARRANTERIGELLRESTPTASHPVSTTPSANVRRQLNQIAREVGVAPAMQFTTFAVECARRLEGAKRTVRTPAL